MKSGLLPARLGYWSSIVILISGAGLVGGILASALYLPTALTTQWEGIEAYAEAYKASGGTITSLSFLAALVSCPAYVLQLFSIASLNRPEKRLLGRLGVAFALIFAVLAGSNYVVQLGVVRAGILAGRTEGLAWLVFQNPDSVMLALDFVGWFFLGLAFLSLTPIFRTGRLERAIRYLMIVIASLGVALIAGFMFRSPAIGQVFLSIMSVTLALTDVLLVVFFKRLL